MEIDFAESKLVNGGLLKKYVGKPVRIFLKVDNTSTGGHIVS